MFNTAHEKEMILRSAHLCMHNDDKGASAHIILVLKARLEYSKLNWKAEPVPEELQNRICFLINHAVPVCMDKFMEIRIAVLEILKATGTWCPIDPCITPLLPIRKMLKLCQSVRDDTLGNAIAVAKTLPSFWKPPCLLIKTAKGCRRADLPGTESVNYERR